MFNPIDPAEAGLLAGSGASSVFMIQISFDEERRCVVARTLNGHPLTGMRKWCVTRNAGSDCNITLSTEAYEQNSSGLGYLGSAFKDVREPQRRIWEDYFNNIKISENAEGKCFMFGSAIRERSTSVRGVGNPWLLGEGLARE